ncbi:MAG: hypothetical protein CTR53_14225 [Ferrovibrio sp.]|nr:MAG: hypothetical protein CTR53_14225 [Ferrovibrio sp.]
MAWPPCWPSGCAGEASGALAGQPGLMTLAGLNDHPAPKNLSDNQTNFRPRRGLAAGLSEPEPGARQGGPGGNRLCTDRTVLPIQAEPGVTFCRVALRHAGAEMSDLVLAHLRTPG